jgi:hypothetical protein
MSRPGSARPVVIKMDSDLGDDIPEQQADDGLSSAEFEELLNEMRGQKGKGKKK